MAEEFDPQKLRDEVNESLITIRDTFASLAAQMQEDIKKVSKEVSKEEGIVVSKLEKSLGKSFTLAQDKIKGVANLRKQVEKGELTSNQIAKERKIIEEAIFELNNDINYARRYGVELGGKDLDNLLKQQEQLDKIVELEQQRVEGLEYQLGGMSKILDSLGTLPFVKELYNGEDASKMMRKTLQETGSVAKSLTKGLSAGFKGFGKGGPLLIGLSLAIKAVQFIVNLFVGAQKTTIDIAKNLGITRAQAEATRKEFVQISKESGKLYLNSQALVESQKELVDLLDRGGRFIQETLTAQTFLTKRLGVNAAEAAKLNSRFEAFGLNAEEGVDRIIELRNRLSESGENTATISQLMEDVGEVSGQIAASFGFSNEAIAQGVIQVRRFGLNLQQARSVAESLLDFESSISAELEAELLTGKQLNLENARMKALTGDIAGATADVMSQMKGLTAEQRKSPIIMKSLASTIGLSVDELQDAYLLETDRARQMEEQLKNQEEYRRQARLIRMDASLDDKQREKELEQLREKLGLTQADRAELEATITTQQAFEESLAKAKDSLSEFVSSGALDKLTDLLIDFVNRASQVGLVRAMFGGGVSTGEQKDSLEKGSNQIQEGSIGKGLNTLAKSHQITQDTLESLIREGKVDKQQLIEIVDRRSQEGIVTPYQQKQYAEIDQQALKEIDVEDFTIRTNPKDTLVMAGGTQLGDETNTLLKELISAVKEGGDVYMDGNKIGQSLRIASYKQG